MFGRLGKWQRNVVSGRPKSPNKIIQTLKVKVRSLSHVRLFGTPWTVAHQAPPSMGFSRQGYWSGVPFHSPGDCPNTGIKPGSPALQVDAIWYSQKKSVGL